MMLSAFLQHSFTVEYLFWLCFTSIQSSYNNRTFICSASTRHSLFVCVYTCLSTYIVFSMYNRYPFQFASPRLWNQLPPSLCLRQPRTNLSDSNSSLLMTGSSSVSTNHFHHPSPRQLFHFILKPFPQFRPHLSLLFLLQD